MTTMYVIERWSIEGKDWERDNTLFASMTEAEIAALESWPDDATRIVLVEDAHGR